MTETTKQRLLSLAVQRLGKERLANELNAPSHLIEAWIGGHATMPDRKLLDLADLLERFGDEPS